MGMAPYSGVVKFSVDGLFMFLPYRLLIHQPPSPKETVTKKAIRQMEFQGIENVYKRALVMNNKQQKPCHGPFRMGWARFFVYPQALIVFTMQ